MDDLALTGGKKVIETPAPHYIWPLITEETKAAVMTQLTDSISIYDKSGIIEVFENRFSEYHQQKYGLLCNSGTMALYSMFKAIDLEKCDEIICPIYTFFATVTPILFTGAKPVFVDCLANGNMDPKKIEQKITAKTKAIIVAHMWGIPCEMDEIVRICRQHKLYLLEDCSHSHGATYKGRLTGTFGNAAIWSLQGQKIITGGEGGILLTNDIDIYSKAQLLGHYNKRCLKEIPYDHPLYKFATTGYGLKLRSHPLAVAIANQQFDKLDTWLANKRKYANLIIGELSSINFLEFPEFPNTQPSWYALIIRYNQSFANNVSFNSFISALHAEGLVEIDIPKSTTPLSLYAIFSQPNALFPEFYEIGESFIEQKEYLEADSFYNSTFKIPVWATKDDESIVMKYIDGIKKVAYHIRNNFNAFF